jgi:hypothetical protein
MGFAGLRQSPSPDKKETLAGYVDFGGGYSVSFTRLFHMYVLFQSNFRFSGKYEYNTFGAFGGKGGVITDVSDRWKSNIYGEALYSPWGKKTPVYRAGAECRLSLSTYVQLVGDFKYEFIYERSVREISGSAQLLF